MTGIRHLFVRGLRAHTEVECHVRTVTGRWRYERLHLLYGELQDELPHQLHGSAACALLQAVKLLCGWSRATLNHTDREPWRTFWSGVRTAKNTDLLEFGYLARLLEPSIAWESAAVSSAHLIGSLAHQAVLADQVPIIQFGDGQFIRWSMVCGLEMSASDAVQALLLLDPGLPGPWGVPYNARLELTSSPRTQPTACPLRSVDGQRWNVALEKLFIIKPGIAEHAAVSAEPQDIHYTRFK